MLFSDARGFDVHLWHRRCIGLIVGFALLNVIGCHRGPKIVPASGRVTYQGKPLKFGTVIFQPFEGQPAKGKIQPDGTFVLSTYKEGDGVVVGDHKIRVTCYSSQDPTLPRTGGERALGKLLIPERYTFYDRSGLVATVREKDNEPFMFDLED